MAIIYGTNGNDNTALGGQSLIGTNARDEIYGLAGNDRLEGRNGHDYLNGGSGYDIILGGNGNDYVVNGTDTGYLDGGSGTDTVDFIGNSAGGWFDLAAGTAKMVSGPSFAMTNFENIGGTEGNDRITGTDGDNRLMGNFGNDWIRARGGNDTVNGGYGNDTIEGDDGNDVINGSYGNDTMYGGDGDDTFVGSAGSDRVDGGAGFDCLSYSANSVRIVAYGQTGKVTHGNGNTEIFQNIEKIIGSNYNDSLVAAPTTDLEGLSGNDSIWSGSGANKLSGGAGTDTLSYYYSTAGVTVNLGSGAAGGGSAQGDTIAGFEILEGSQFADMLTGTSGSNTLRGLNGNDTMNGGGGNDSLYSGEGNDRIDGGAGNDLVDGGGGADTLWGGTGADRFRFYFRGDSLPGTGNMDLINDFSRSQGDRIDLSALSGTFAFIGNASFSAANQVRFQQSGGATIIEVNTTGPSGAEMAIQLTGTINLQAGDFLL